MIECPKCKSLFADEKAENSFDLNIPLIECTKCGFKFEGVQRKGYHIYDGSDRDNLVYSMLREEWESIHETN